MCYQKSKYSSKEIFSRRLKSDAGLLRTPWRLHFLKNSTRWLNFFHKTTVCKLNPLLLAHYNTLLHTATRIRLEMTGGEGNKPAAHSYSTHTRLLRKRIREILVRVDRNRTEERSLQERSQRTFTREMKKLMISDASNLNETIWCWTPLSCW